VPAGTAGSAATAQAASELRHTLRSLSGLALAGDPATPESFALIPAVRRLAEVMPFRVQVNLDPVQLAPAVAATAYAAICEALANVVGHAGARQAIITVRRHGPTAQIAVSDDGAGGARPVLGGGIVTVAARATALGGLLHIDSPPGSGTHFTLELPRGA
jgi:signal transduction histidine kinase